MKKTFSILLTLALVLSFSVVAVPTGVVGASTSTIDVTQPVQVTSDSHYERGESIIYDGSNYWLFYGRSDTVTATYGTGGNPDIHDYKVYYKKASTVAGLASATATLVPGTHNNNIYNGETTAAYQGGKVRVFAARDEGASFTLYQFYYDGSTWKESTIKTGMGEGHAAAAECNGDLWLAYQMGSKWTSKYWDGSWHGEYDIIADPYGTAKFYVEGTNLYFVRADANYQDIFQWSGSTWSLLDSDNEALAYDPTIYKIGSNYVCANAPWDGTKQWIKAKVSTTLSSLLSSPTSTVNITAGGYGSNAWVDMWPAGFTDNSGDTYLFYTSERDPSDPMPSGSSDEVAGNIWYLKVYWPVTNDHYTYIQNAVDAATSTTVYVWPGTYKATVTLPHHSLNIIGAGKDLVTWDGNGVRCIDWTEPPATPVITSCRFEISGFTFQSYMPPVNGGMIKICKVNRYQNIGFGLDFHDNRLITSGDSNYGLWLCRNSLIARDPGTGDSAVRIHDNIFETTSGICMSNSDNYDIYDNDFTYDVVGNGFATRKNAAIFIGSGCTSEQPSRGGHHIWGNDFALVGAGYNGTEATYPRGAICIEHYSGQTGLTLLANTIECNTFDNPNGSGIHYYLGDNVAYPTAIVKHNSFSGNLWGIFIDGSYADNLKVLAENNWWGDSDGSGPYDPQDENLGGVAEINEVPPCPTTDGIRKMMNTDGSGDEVCGRVDYCPWLDYSAATTTGAGNASFTCSHGCINNLTAVSPTPPNQPVELPYGVFSFNISCIDPGQQVTVTVKLPGPVPVGSVWWKYQGGSWYWLPIGSDNGDDTITVTLTDGGQGDEDGAANGQIIDDGGPGALSRGLIVRSTEGGRVTKPGEGNHVYESLKRVKLVATPDDGYKFVAWTGDVRRIDDVNAASTTITMDWDYVIIANFVTVETTTVETEVQYELNVSSTIGGSVGSPGEGTFPYIEGTVVSLAANPDTGYRFVNWTGDGIKNTDSTTVTITMNGDYDIMANFEFEQTTTTDPSERSSGPLACFIATAAYGTQTAEQIDVLREFRDVVLLENSVGSQFVDLYYKLSPPVADFMAGNSFLKTMVRELMVDPIVWVVEATGDIWRN